jgi:hypothetical protein
MAAREWLAIIQESAYNTPIVTGSQVTTPGSTQNVWYLRLDGSDAFTMRPVPTMVAVPYGGGYAIDAFRVSDKTECKGRLTTKLYQGTLSTFLLSWAGVRINSAQTAPWTTTEPPGDLASCAIVHSIQYTTPSATTSTIVRGYTGCKVEGYDFSISEESQIGTLNLDLSASTPLPAIEGGSAPSWFPSAPTDGLLPGPQQTSAASPPYVFIHAGTGPGGTSLVLGGGGSPITRVQFQSINISSRTVLMKRYWANQFAQIMRFCGRSTTLQAQHFYNLTPDDRVNYEALTTMTPATFQIYASSSEAITWNFNANSVLTTVTDQLALNDLYLQTFQLTNQYDGTASAGYAQDYSLTFIPSAF